MIKVLNIQPFDSIGSIQFRCLRVALELRPKGVNTVFVTPKEGFSFTRIAVEKGFKVYKTHVLRPVYRVNDKISLLHTIKFFAKIPENIIEIYKLFRSENPDVIQVNGFVCVQEALASVIVFRRKFLWNLLGTVYPRIIIALCLPLIRLASLRVFVSKKLISYYFGKPSDKVIFEPVDTTMFDPRTIDQREVMKVKTKLSLDFDDRVIGFVGFISPVKGIEYLIKGFKMVKNQIDNEHIKLVIVGGVPRFQKKYYSELRNLVSKLRLEEHVIFTGHVQHEMIPLMLSIFDILVLPSLQEGTPVCILEAMAMKKPIIATDVGGISELVLNGITGILVKPYDEKQLAESILHLLKNSELSKIMGEKGRFFVESKFSPRSCALAYYDLYKALTECTLYNL